MTLPRKGLLVALAGLAGWIGCEANQPPGAVGSRMLSYAAPTLEGDTVDVTALREEAVVLLNVWATWCAPCRREIPELQELQRRWGADGLRVVGVSVDAPGSEDDVARFLEAFDVDYTILLDPRTDIAGLLGVVGMPTTVLIDRRGVIRWRHLGAVTADDPALLDALRSAL